MIDPFLGGGSSFFLLNPKSALLGDLNSELIELYQAVREHPRRITERLRFYHARHSAEFYYDARAIKPGCAVERAAWFLYLNRTCWNGLFRVNLRGEFNVPIGTKTKVFDGEEELDAASMVLSRARLVAGDFEGIINEARSGDVVFADPPYFDRVSSRFLKYNANVFSWNDQIRLREALLRASTRGAHCFVTNSNHVSLVNLYRSDGEVHQLSRHSVVAGYPSGRKKDHEILVRVK